MGKDGCDTIQDTTKVTRTIENILNLISTRLAQEAVEKEINKESLDEFATK